MLECLAASQLATRAQRPLTAAREAPHRTIESAALDRLAPPQLAATDPDRSTPERATPTGPRRMGSIGGVELAGITTAAAIATCCGASKVTTQRGGMRPRSAAFAGTHASGSSSN